MNWKKRANFLLKICLDTDDHRKAVELNNEVLLHRHIFNKKWNISAKLFKIWEDNKRIQLMKSLSKNYSTFVHSFYFAYISIKSKYIFSSSSIQIFRINSLAFFFELVNMVIFIFPMNTKLYFKANMIKFKSFFLKIPQIHNYLRVYFRKRVTVFLNSLM